MVGGEHKYTRTSFGVGLEGKHDFWSTIPSRRDILGHISCILFWINRETSCQTEIANLQLTVSIDKQVARLQVTMKDVCRVYVFQAAEDLVDKGLEVGVCERLA